MDVHVYVCSHLKGTDSYVLNVLCDHWSCLDARRPLPASKARPRARSFRGKRLTTILHSTTKPVCPRGGRISCKRRLPPFQSQTICRGLLFLPPFFANTFQNSRKEKSSYTLPVPFHFIGSDPRHASPVSSHFLRAYFVFRVISHTLLFSKLKDCFVIGLSSKSVGNNAQAERFLCNCYIC